MIRDRLHDAAELGRVVQAHVAGLRWSDASEAVRNFLSDNPDDSEGHRIHGDVCREMWRLDDARAAFEQAIAIERDNAEARAGLGFVQIVGGRVDEGIASCRWAIQLRSDLAAPHRYLASALIAHGEAAAAAERALEARRLAPRQPENTIVLASAWFRCGLRSGALRLVDRVIRDHPTRAEAWATRAAFRLAVDDLSGAAADLDRALAIKPWLPPAHALHARIHVLQDHLADAFAAIARARAGNPGSEEYLLLESAWFAATGNRRRALATCQAEWWRHPKSRELKARVSMWLLEEGRVDDARQFISGLPGDAALSAMWRRLGDIWLELGSDYGHEARTCYLQIGAEDKDATLQVSIAELFSRAGDSEAALAHLDGLDSPAAAALAAECLERLKRPDDALDRMSKAVALHPNDAFAAMRLGMVYRSRGAVADAEPHLRRAAVLAPDEPVAFEQLAIFLSDQGRHDEALKAFRSAAELSPDALSIRSNMAILLCRQRRWAEAERAFRQIMSADPGQVQAIAKLASVLAQQKRWAEAAELLEIAIERVPDDVSMRDALVHAYRALHRIDAALDAARRWVEDAPDAFPALAMLARQLAAQKDAKADAVADEAWALAPESTKAIEMRADVATQLGRYREAVEWLDRGLAIEPDNPGLLTYRGLVIQECESPAAGEGMLRRVLAVAPEINDAPVNLALLGLRQGAFDEGWRLYEARDSAVRDPTALNVARDRAGAPLDLTRASVLVRAEQGLGDTLHFMRYVSRLAEEARDVVFQMPEGIVWTARHLGKNVRVYGNQERVPPTDFHTALMSLPRYYRTDQHSIPADVPYVSVDPARRERWRARIGDAGFKIGISWHTDPGHGSARRWIPLSQIAPLADIPGVRLISLQRFHGLDQLAQVPGTRRIERLGDRFDEGPDAFVDSAAVMSALDLVISIDTAIAHLSAAMARPTWVLLHRTADWRWLTDREDSPWYPTVRLFRQRISDDWDEVGARLFDCVRAVVAGGPVLWPVPSA